MYISEAFMTQYPSHVEKLNILENVSKKMASGAKRLELHMGSEAPKEPVFPRLTYTLVAEGQATSSKDRAPLIVTKLNEKLTILKDAA